MMFFRSTVLFCPLVCLLAQAPPPSPKPAAAPPQPTVTMSTETPAPPPVVAPDKVIISVGETKLTFAQFQEMINALPEQYRAAARGPARKQFADQLVHIMVLSQEGRRRKLDETDAYRTQVQFQNSNILAGLAFDQINKDTKVGDAELHKYYDDHKADYEEVHARHILIRMQGSQIPVRPGQKDLTEAEALAKAQELRKKVQAGGDFSAVAISESDDSSSATKGGDLPPFKRGQMIPAFEEAAFAMKAGDLSEPVKSQFGYHLIQVVTHETKTFDMVRGDIEQHLRPELAKKALDDLEKKNAVTLDPEYFPPAPPAAAATTVPLGK